jgi:hypothetical protein
MIYDAMFREKTTKKENQKQQFLAVLREEDLLHFAQVFVNNFK